MANASQAYHDIEKRLGHIRIQYDFSDRNQRVNYYPRCRSLTRYEVSRVNQVGLAIFLILSASLAIIASPFIFVIYKIFTYQQIGIRRENSVCFHRL